MVLWIVEYGLVFFLSDVKFRMILLGKTLRGCVFWCVVEVRLGFELLFFWGYKEVICERNEGGNEGLEREEIEV